MEPTKLVVGTRYVFRQVVIYGHDVIIAMPRDPAAFGATIYYLDPTVLDLFSGIAVMEVDE